jgi:formate dehydrogenase major subunit
MTNHWNDIGNSDVIMIIGSNAAENHPISFKFVQKAMDKRDAKLIVVDPRYTRSAAKASVVDGVQLYSKMRSGTDIAFMLGMMKYAVDNGRINYEYVKKCTNASFLLNTGFETCRNANPHPAGGNQTGIFSGLVTDTARHKAYKYNKATWGYQYVAVDQPDVDLTLTDSDCAWQKFVEHISAYTIATVSDITGADPTMIQKIYEIYTSTYLDDKSACIMYAMGSTQHTYGSQNVRSYAMMQLLLGNAGVAGGGINALRGESNVQGSTDMCLLWHILPGYLGVTNNSVGKKDRAAYKYNYSSTPGSPKAPKDPTTGDPVSLSWWKFGGKYIDSLIQAWWPMENNPLYVPTVNESLIMDNGYHRLPKADSSKWYTHT